MKLKNNCYHKFKKQNDTSQNYVIKIIRNVKFTKYFNPNIHQTMNSQVKAMESITIYAQLVCKNG